MTTTIHAAPDASWRRRAACRHLAPSDGEQRAHWWYPTRDGDGDNHGALAKAVCRSCPVREACLLTALEAGEDHGIHGGAGEARRRVLRRALSAGVLDVVLAAHWRRLDGVEALDGDDGLLAVYGSRARHARPGTYAKGCRCEACGLAVGMREVVASLHAPTPVTAEATALCDELFGSVAA